MRHRKQSKQVVDLAKRLRKRMSFPELLLWAKLKPSVNGTFDIRRQYPILDRYVVDFFYEDLQLAIEIDGAAFHEGRAEADALRQHAIEQTGVIFVRIPARWVLRDRDEAAQFILDICAGVIDIDEIDESLR